MCRRWDDGPSLLTWPVRSALEESGLRLDSARRTHPAGLFFSCRQLFSGCLLLLRVAAQIVIRRPVGAYAMALTEDSHRRALHLAPGGVIQIRRQFLIGPVGPVESTTLGAVLHPPLERWSQRFWNAARLPRRPLNL